MKTIVALAFLATCFTTPAFATDTKCVASATQAKLAGAAKTAHIKKCREDAKAVCEASAKTNRLSGVAAASHVNKCTNDAVGAMN